MSGGSAFFRRHPARTVDLGTRAGLHGQVLVSTGLAGLDRLLGGGLPLGSLLLVAEDACSGQHVNLIKCFLAEGLACRHSVAWVTAEADALTPESTAAFLPPQLQRSSSRGQASTSQPGPAGGGPAAAPAAATLAAGVPPDDGLKIAWQYRKYIQGQQQGPGGLGAGGGGGGSTSTGSGSGGSSSSSSSAAKSVAAGIAREWCHQHDLTRGSSPEQLAGARLETCCCRHAGGGAVQAADAATAAFVQRFQPTGPIPVPSRDPGSVGRIAIQSLGAPSWWPAGSEGSGGGGSSGNWRELEASMLQMVADLRLRIQDATCAALITCPTGLFSESFTARLQHLSDAVLCVQSLADDSDIHRLLPDPTSASALLEVRRLPHLGLLRQRHTDDRLHLIRHKRRGISVSPLDLLPLEAVEQQPQQQGGGGSGGSDVPAALKICGRGPGGVGGVLDF